jgi:hypothetical protein
MRVMIEVEPPKFARWMTTDENGLVCFWRAKPRADEDPEIGDGFEWHCPVTRGKYKGWSNEPLVSIHTGIPRPDWRDCIVKVERAAPRGGEE